MFNNRFFLMYVISIPLFLILDGLWLGVISSDLYAEALSHLLGPVNWAAVMIFYPIFLLGLCYFCSYPAASLRDALMRGGLFGFFTYLTYDMTNLATLRDWPLGVSLIDIVWGTIVCGLVSAGSYFLYTRIHKQ